MIVVQLMGGIGNQMFQYACGRAVALRAGKPLCLDASQFLSKNQPYKFELGNFNVDAEVFQSMDELKMIAQKNDVDKINIFKEAHFHFDSRVIGLRDNFVLAGGYWQSEKYFQDFADVIRVDFKPRIGTLSAEGLDLACQMQQGQSISVHVRRGDYTNPLNIKVHGLLPMDYYMRAIDNIHTRIINAHCYMFSDDLDWCYNAFENIENITFVEHNRMMNVHEDLWLMSQCKHNIIANSSYSWWGAWLNQHPDKIVIAPQIWFVGGGHDTKDLVPGSWMEM